MYRMLMTVVAANGIVFGLANLFVPDLLLSILGGEVDALGRNIFQALGGTILGYGAVAWFVRELDEGPIRRGVIAGVTISFAAIAAVVGIATASGLLNALAWAVVAIHAAVAIGLLVDLLRPAGPGVTTG